MVFPEIKILLVNIRVYGGKKLIKIQILINVLWIFTVGGIPKVDTTETS